jgi:transcriptional regulator of acetoin/glycerol metabolism
MLAQKLVSHRVPILLQGETGTGKEVFARALHTLSDRYVGRFVAVNCAAIPANRVEAELFGYGASTVQGQHNPGYRGRILEANGGVLFLDEISDLPIAVQPRLLEVLERGEITPIGSTLSTPVDVEIISASHQDLESSVRVGRFREDLYYRLCGLRIALPPLRERSDRRLLFDAILQEESNGRASFDPGALEALDRHGWLGNLRELRNVLRVALAFADGGVVRAENLPLPCVAGVSGEPGPDDERGRLLREILKQNWNISAAARQMGMSRNTLYRHMRRLSIQLPERGGGSHTPS